MNDEQRTEMPPEIVDRQETSLWILLYGTYGCAIAAGLLWCAHKVWQQMQNIPGRGPITTAVVLTATALLALFVVAGILVQRSCEKDV